VVKVLVKLLVKVLVKVSWPIRLFGGVGYTANHLLFLRHAL